MVSMIDHRLDSLKVNQEDHLIIIKSKDPKLSLKFSQEDRLITTKSKDPKLSLKFSQEDRLITTKSKDRKLTPCTSDMSQVAFQFTNHNRDSCKTLTSKFKHHK